MSSLWKWNENYDYVIPKKAETEESCKRKCEQNLLKTSKKICKSEIGDQKYLKIDQSQIESSKSRGDEILTHEERIFIFLSDDFYTSIASFLLSILPLFGKANLNFQTNKPIIYVARSLLLDFLKDLLSKFILLSIVKNTKSLKNIDYHSLKNKRSDENLVIGNSTEKILADLILH